MQFTIDRDTFASALRRILPFADPKSTMPIYGHVKIRVNENLLVMTAANATFEVTCQIELPHEVDDLQDGMACVMADHFSGLVASLRADQMVNVDFAPGGKLLIESGNTKAVFPSADPESFPIFDNLFPLPQIVVKAGELDRVLGLTRPAMGIDPDRMTYWGTSLMYERVGTSVAALNGMLGVVSRLHEDHLSEFPAVILPRPLCVRLRGLLKNTTGVIQISITPSAVRITAADWVITSKLIDGTFSHPNGWSARLVDQPIVCNSEEFNAILARIDAATDLDYQSKRLKQRGVLVKVEAGIMSLRDGANTVSDQMSVNYDGTAPIEFGLNTKHIRDAITALDSHEVELHFQDRDTSIRVCAHGEPEDGFTTAPYRIN